MKRYIWIALVFVMAAGLMMGCSSDTQANEEHEKALAELRTELEEVQAELATTQAELEAAQAENARLLEQINVVDSPAAPEAEQGTKGAADNTQSQPPTSDQALKDDVDAQKRQEQDKQPTPSNQDKWENSSSSSVQNPTQQDVNDLLNDTFGQPSKPSGGTSSGGLVEGNDSTDLGDPSQIDGSGLGNAGTGSLDAWK